MRHRFLGAKASKLLTQPPRVDPFPSSLEPPAAPAECPPRFARALALITYLPPPVFSRLLLWSAALSTTCPLTPLSSKRRTNSISLHRYYQGSSSDGAILAVDIIRRLLECSDDANGLMRENRCKRAERLEIERSLHQCNTTLKTSFVFL